MILRVDSARWRCDAPAKLNLSLEVLGKRADGFHEIETLMTPVDLADFLEFRSTSSSEILFSCSNTVSRFGASRGFDSVPLGSENLVVRALELVRRRYDISSGAEVRLLKRIPAAAGLGGGSSDAAAALRLANAGWGLNFSVDALSAIGAELGSDIPFFLQSTSHHVGPAICRGRGELVEPIDAIGPLHFVIAKPDAGLSTADVFAQCQPVNTPKHIRGVVDSLRRGDLFAAARGFFNRLTEAAISLVPEIRTTFDRLARFGCFAWQMSGSGTSCFGLCAHRRQAERAAAWMRGQGYWAMAVCSR